MENETLVDYMLRLQNAADHLIRGGILTSYDTDTTIEIRDDELTRQKKAFSIFENSIDDELEEFSYGELKRIQIIMEFIQDGEHDKAIKDSLRVNKDNTKTEFYKITMNRAKKLLKYIVIVIISGNLCELSQEDYQNLINMYSEDDEYLHKGQDKKFLKYDVMKGQFNVVNSEGETIVEDIHTINGVFLFTEFLERKEKEKMRREAMKYNKEEEK